MAQVRVDEVHITLERHEAEGLATLLTMAPRSLLDTLHLDSLDDHLYGHKVYPDDHRVEGQRLILDPVPQTMCH